MEKSQLLTRISHGSHRGCKPPTYKASVVRLQCMCVSVCACMCLCDSVCVFVSLCVACLLILFSSKARAADLFHALSNNTFSKRRIRLIRKEFISGQRWELNNK